MVSLLNWWYTRGLRGFLARTRTRISNLTDTFSIGLLVKTFFEPFRQISANTASHAPLGVKLRMALDKLTSRIIGAFVRFFIILAGLFCIVFLSLIAAILIVLWPLVPAFPVLGVIMAVIGAF